MSKWSDQYNDSRWQEKRLKVMERDKFQCRSCGKKKKGAKLSVHHSYYEKDKNVWEYPDSTLITWCAACHEKRHAANKILASEISRLDQFEFDGLISLVIGYDTRKFFAACFGTGFLSDDILTGFVDSLSEAFQDGQEEQRDA